MKQTKYRGRTITDDQVLQAMQRFDQELRSTFPQRQWKVYAVEYKGQLYPPKTILRLITGGSVPPGGTQANSRFEDLGFKVVTIDEPPQRYAQGANVVVIDPQLLDVFPDGATVNEALRALAPVLRQQRRSATKRRSA